MRLFGSGDPLLLKALGRLSPALLAEVVWGVVLGRPRSLTRIARQVTAAMDPPPKIDGLKHIPRREPFLLVANHFQAPDLWIGWVAAAITSAVASVRDPDVRELHWLVASEWRWLEVAGRWVPNPLTSFFFPRAARTWGMVTMPEHPERVAGRARGIMQALAYMGRRTRGAGQGTEPVAVFPEGMATVTLGEARPGFGAFAYRVSVLGVPLLPVGVFQEDEVLAVRIGEPLTLGEFPGPAGGDLDDWARQRVMVAIGSLLPASLRGRYAGQIGKHIGTRSED